jgi:hypothetical protein
MREKFQKISIRILVVLLISAAVILALRATFNFTAGRKLEKYLEEAKAEGIPLSASELAPDCPKADNGAALWRAAEALVYLEKHDGPLLARITDELTLERPPDEKSRQDLFLLVEKNRKALDLAAEASARPCLRFGDWNGPPGDPRLLTMVRVTKLLAADAVLRRERGDLRGALDECRVSLRLAWRIMDEPSLITTLVAVADAKLTLCAFQSIARGAEIEAGVLDAWIKEIDTGAWRGRLNRCILYERTVGLEWGLRTIGGQPAVLSAGLGAAGAEKVGSGIFDWLVRPVLKSQFIWVHKRYGELDKIAGEPYYRQNEFLNERHLERVPWYYRPTGVLFPEFHSVFLKEASLEAMMLTTRAGLACKIYRSKTGRYPGNIEALVPDILPDIPIDPFTGKPLVYKTENRELLIYSFGSNQKDDGGRMGPMTQLVMEKDDDWTWREKTR